MEIFIHEWKIQDYKGRRALSTKSKRTIDGVHAYACIGLTTWFRLGKYLIKHDVANYLLGLTELMSKHENQDDDVIWRDWRKEILTPKYSNCVDEIVSVVNQMFPAGDYIETLLVMQEALNGYEKCYYISKANRLRFDYKQFLSDRNAYQARLEEFAQAEHERRLKEECPPYSETETYQDGQVVLKEGRVYIFHGSRFVLVPKVCEYPIELRALQRYVMEKLTTAPDTDELFVTLENYGLTEEVWIGL